MMFCQGHEPTTSNRWAPDSAITRKALRSIRARAALAAMLLSVGDRIRGRYMLAYGGVSEVCDPADPDDLLDLDWDDIE